IEGLSPTIAIEQKTTSRNPRSTVATQTEIYDYLRLLFARVGDPSCPQCGRKIESQSAEQIVDKIMERNEGTPITLLAPLVKGRKGEYRQIPSQIAKAGSVRYRANGKMYEVNQELKLDRYKMHNIEIVVERLNVKPAVKKRLADSVETALRTGGGLLMVDYNGKFPEETYSEKNVCPHCSFSIPEIEPRLFSFNSPYGACPECKGLGTRQEIDPELLIPDDTKPWVNAIAPAKRGRRGYLMYYRAVMREFADLHKLDAYAPYSELKSNLREKILYGSNDQIWGKPYEGAIPYMERMFRDTDSEWLKDEINRYMSEQPCPGCEGTRLKKEALSVKIDKCTIAQLSAMSIKEAKEFFSNLKFTNEKQKIAAEILKEI